jgi:hypothetical protein
MGGPVSPNTPGPWRISGYITGAGVGTQIYGADHTLVCTPGNHFARAGGLHEMFAHHPGKDRMDADARLIAAAPDMLEDGSVLLQAWDRYVESGADEDYAAFEQALGSFAVAIAKARGKD